MDTSTDIAAFEPAVFKLPFPEDFEDATYTSFVDRFDAMMGAAESIHRNATASGQQITISEDERAIPRDVFSGALPPSSITTTAESIHLCALLNAYDLNVVKSAQQLRNFCTNILIDKAANGKTEAVQLRAVEMIGKIKDVALFEERSTVLVAQMTTEDIKKALHDKLAGLRSAIAEAQTVEVHHEETPSRI